MSRATKKNWFTNKNALRTTAIAAVVVAILTTILVIILFLLVATGWQPYKTVEEPEPPNVLPGPPAFYWLLSPETWFLSPTSTNSGLIYTRDVLPPICLSYENGSPYGQGSPYCILEYVRSQGGLCCIMGINQFYHFYYGGEPTAALPKIDWNAWVTTPLLFKEI